MAQHYSDELFQGKPVNLAPVCLPEVGGRDLGDSREEKPSCLRRAAQGRHRSDPPTQP